MFFLYLTIYIVPTLYQLIIREITTVGVWWHLKMLCSCIGEVGCDDDIGAVE